LNKFDPKLITGDSIILARVSLVTEDENLNHPYILKSNSSKLLELKNIDLINEESSVNKNKYQHLYRMNREKLTFDIDGLNIIIIPQSKLLQSLEKGVTQGLFQSAHEELKKYGDLNKCMIKFEILSYSIRNKTIAKVLTSPVYSNLIENYKLEILHKNVISSPSNEEPLIIRCVSKPYARYNISEEIFVLCSFIDRDDILIEFLQFDKNDNDKIVWFKIVQFNHTDVFNNCAFVFNPPVYDFYEEKVELPLMTKVYFRLYKPSTKSYSNLIEFYYIQDDSNYLDSYSTDFLKSCATYSMNKASRKFNFNKRENKPNIVNTEIKEDKMAAIEEDAPRCGESSLESLKNKPEASVDKKMEIQEVISNVKTENMEIEENEKKISIEEIGDKKLKEEDKKEKINNKVEKQPTSVKDYRLLLEKCEKKMNGLADRTSTALLKVSETRSLYSLIATQRYLLSAQNDDGNTPLHIAISNSNFDILEVFVDIATTIPEYDIINMKNFSQLTPLLLAAHQKETEVCRYLLESGSNISLTDSTGSNCFHIACKNSDTNLLEILIDFIVTKEKNRSSIDSILNKFNYDSLTPLHIAAKSNCLKAVELIVKSGYCRINEKSVRDGMTALHFSAKFGFLKIVELLLKQSDIIVDSKTHSGLTPLHLAVINKNYFVVRKLIANQANIFQETEKCLNIACGIKECKDSSYSISANLKNSKDLNNGIQSILENSKKHNNAYHYANNDELMYYLFKNEKMIPKSLINKILLNETRKLLKPNSDNQIEKKILIDDNFDIITLFERRISENKINKKLSVGNFTEKSKDSLTVIDSELGSLSIDEKSIPIEILNYENLIDDIEKN
jgi:ankyrin repeat protein